MIEKIWFENHPLRYALWPLLWPLSLAFGMISRSRRRAFMSGSKASYQAPVPVIVVGNITAGGNGKTPVVIWLVEQLQSLGYKPGVVSRGYGAKAPSYPLIVEEHTPTKHCGDEPKLIFKRTQAPVSVSPVRSDAVKALLPLGVDIVITDDGLQHYALRRDIEIVVVDGNRRFGSEKLIPLGPLREAPSRLNEVDFIITNGGRAHENEAAMTLTPSLAVNLKTRDKTPVSELEQLVAMAGIGHPPRFFQTLEKLGARTVVTQGFPDHKDFEPSELQTLASRGQHLIMTEKDAVKCASYAEENWWYLPVTASFSPEDETRILSKIKEVKEKYGPPTA
ncbi:tetraacyldisaccharide 4'-kinase [Vibrio neptunius]|uniref:Tetraacyldisaccharide 4'-kinase n=1 Tax=Vibrio neptunius TaxID=170651 RepID=A0ABS2ZYF1_9VIBR|nr:tetraacyldisaccharide 4'-kinase [Vibrio neptunius]MBN3515290.1 tetraacyldisaccharide 4'-kinase [Vibrio neptunius]MBN3548834.1 tetraacyldisaccharide 4'-kinase [Vibrio neptunius]MBN3577296.1 tetraacyldisaccharide 4'-kinase [Vibrio neptunius]MCH9870960.1 tetraacyldisaccharide 4'-kinase [Vibrio neptunius]